MKELKTSRCPTLTATPTLVPFICLCYRIEIVLLAETPPNRSLSSKPMFWKRMIVIRDAVLRKWSVEVKFTIFTTKLTLLIEGFRITGVGPEFIGFVHGQMSEIQLERSLDLLKNNMIRR